MRKSYRVMIQDAAMGVTFYLKDRYNTIGDAAEAASKWRIVNQQGQYFVKIV